MFQQYEAELQAVLADAEARLGALLAAADTADRSGAVRQLNDLVRTARDLEKQIDETRIALRKRAVNRIINNDSGVYAELIYIEIINAFERIANHSRNILQTLPHKFGMV